MGQASVAILRSPSLIDDVMLIQSLIGSQIFPRTTGSLAGTTSSGTGKSTIEIIRQKQREAAAAAAAAPRQPLSPLGNAANRNRDEADEYSP